MRTLALCTALALGGVAATQSPKPAPTTGTARPQCQAVDDLILGVLAEDKIPGAALAVTKGGRLVYARGYGLADPVKGTPVEPNALFRVASISKPFTAAAVLKLVDAGKLKLDDPVVPLLKLAPILAPGAKADPRWQAVTVGHLLRHEGGFDRAASGDPMFMPAEIAAAAGVASPPGPREVIRFVLGRPLDFDPGSRSAYSNFGYCVLGRAIEAVTGESYETYVRAAILKPIGVTRMKLGRTLEKGRWPGEVRYADVKRTRAASVFDPHRGEKVPAPYGAWNLEAMDAHGGWVASPPDLVRFLAALADPARFPALKGPHLQAHFKPGYGFNGYLDGTSTTFRWMKAGNLGFALLFNGTARDVDNSPAAKASAKLPGLLRDVAEWPSGDLFDTYLK